MELKELSNNQTVGLAMDVKFRAIFWGPYVPDDPELGQLALVYVEEPGETGKKKGAAVTMPINLLVAVQRVWR